MQANQPLYHRLDSAKFLRQLLAGKAVIEYPALIVLLPHELDMYSLADDGGCAEKPAEAASV